MVSANLLVRLFAPFMGLDGVFVTSFYYGFSACSGAAARNLAENLSCVNDHATRKRDPAWLMTLHQNPCLMLLCATAQLENSKVKEGPQCPQIHTPFTGLNWSH